jgi:hypothetical protein
MKTIGRTFTLACIIGIPHLWIGGHLSVFVFPPAMAWVVGSYLICYKWSIGFISPESPSISGKQIYRAARSGLILSNIIVPICVTLYSLGYKDGLKEAALHASTLTAIGLLYSVIVYYAAFFPYFYKKSQNIDELKKKY